MAATRYVALLRAINVGGHTVKMDALRAHFTRMGFANVETFIASGNVLFDASGSAQKLEERIETELERTLGYPVATFVRTAGELAAVVRQEPFPQGVIDPEHHSLYIGFLRDKPSADTAKRVAALRTPVDELAVHGRELYWGCRTRISETEVSGALLERTLGTPMTSRNITTVRKLAAKLNPSLSS
jgi:uncharacterized protein (DUF1697 family)